MSEENQYFIKVADDDEKGFFYESNERCREYGEQNNKSFVIESPFEEGVFADNKSDYREITKEDYDMLTRLAWMNGEGYIREEVYREVLEKVMDLALNEQLV